MTLVVLLCLIFGFKGLELGLAYHVPHTQFRAESSSRQYLFGNWGKKNDVGKTVSDSKDSGPKIKILTPPPNSKGGELEKISRTQNRDYNAEAAALGPKVVVIRDLQKGSKPDGFPNLYKGWIKAEGDQIAKQIIKSSSAALKKGEKCIEVLFDPVPNLDEVAFGTTWNKMLRKEVVANLKVPEYAANRGGPAILEWSNIYWANRLGVGIQSVVGGAKKQIMVLSISGEGVKGKDQPTLAKGLTLVSLNIAKKPGAIETLTEGTGGVGAFILISPCSQSHYKDGEDLSNKYNAPVIALNSPYSFRYDVGGGKPFTLAYVMKRIPKGWIFRNYPNNFEGIVEGPNYDISVAQSYAEQPALPVIAKATMDYSTEKYGKVGNDRIFQQRL